MNLRSRHPFRFLIVGIAILIGAGLPGSVAAQTQQQIDWCYGKAGATTDQTIIGCTSMIESKSPEAEIAFRNRAFAYFNQGDVNRTLDDINQAIRLQPDDSFALDLRCAVRNINGDLEGALADCNKAIRLGLEVHQTCGFVFLKLGKYSEARADFDVAIKLSVSSESFYGRGLARRKGGDLIGGDADIETAKRRWGGVGEFLAKRGIIN